MRHKMKVRKFNRTPKHRKSMLRYPFMLTL